MILVVKALCLAIGYFFGCFLTAEFVAKRTAGVSSFDIGSHNPGMANIAAELGFKPAALTLLGDILKTMVACWGCWLLFGHASAANRVLILYAGLGVTIGHNLPFWTGFRGGKGVATTCVTIFCFNPLWGLICCIIGLVISVVSGYLPFGAISIPLSFLIPTAVADGTESTVIVVLLSAMMLWRHWTPLVNAIDGVEPKVNFKKVIANLRDSYQNHRMDKLKERRGSAGEADRTRKSTPRRSERRQGPAPSKGTNGRRDRRQASGRGRRPGTRQASHRRTDGNAHASSKHAPTHRNRQHSSRGGTQPSKKALQAPPGNRRTPKQ